MATSEKLLNAVQVAQLTRLVGAVRSQLPEDLDAELATALVRDAERILADLGKCFITDDLIDLGRATRQERTDEEVIRNWQELATIRGLILPLVHQLYEISWGLRTLTPSREVDSTANAFQRIALRLETEYRWLEQQVCPGIDKVLRAPTNSVPG